MNKLLLLLYISLPLTLTAENISTLFERVTQSDLYNSQTQTIEKNIQNTKASLYNDNWTIGGGTTYATFDSGDKGMEYQISIGKDIMIHHSQLKELLQNSENYAQILKKIKENQLKSLIFRLYGEYCITMDSLRTKAELASIYDTLDIQIQKGVELGEFSSNKAIMANLSFQNMILEISRIESQLQEYEGKIKSLVPFDGEFECKHNSLNFDKLFARDSSLYFDLLEQQKQTSLSKLDVASNQIQNVNVNALYTQELDTERYTLNLSVPLSFDSTRYEATKASTMHDYSALNYQISSFAKRYKEETKALKTRLNIYKVHVSKTEESIKKDSDKLIKQSNLRFKAGEESLIEILKATQTQLQIVDTILHFKQQRHRAVSDYLYNYAINPQGVLQK